jgi:hypothetical protein
MLSFEFDTNWSCCGVMEAGSFIKRSIGNTEDVLDSFSDDLSQGTGMFLSTFVNTPVCKETYELFCERYKLLYQSEPKCNPSSGNRVFLCVFELKGN